MIAFWVLAPIMVLAALGILFVRKAVHAALLLAVVMISLAVLYAALEAPFLFAVQIIVYTGAILMLFLFVLMLVGVDASDSVVETIRGQRLLAIVGGLVLGLMLVLGRRPDEPRHGRSASEVANADGNIEGLANILFSRYVFAFEVTSALLITAAMGAMVLAHRERLTPKPTQASIAADRVQGVRRARPAPRPAAPTRRVRPAQRGRHPGPAAGRHAGRGLGLPRARGPRRGPPASARRRADARRAAAGRREATQ